MTLHPQAEKAIEDVQRLLCALLSDGVDKSVSIRLRLVRGEPTKLQVYQGAPGKPVEIRDAQEWSEG